MNLVRSTALLALCLASAHGDAQPQLVRKGAHALVAGAAGVPEDELRSMLAKVIQNPQMQKMAKDPALVSGLMELMRDPDKMAQLTGDSDLAQSLNSLVEKDPHALTQMMKEAGFDVGFTDDDINSASMDEIHSELLRLKNSDEDHMQRLRKNNDMRDALKKKLGAVVNNAMANTNEVEERLRAIKEGGEGKEDNAKMSTIVKEDGSLIQSMKHRSLKDLEDLDSVEEIESSLEELSKHMNRKIKTLHSQDDMELEALQDNAQVRNKLKDKLQEHIREQQKELSFASEGTRSLD